MRPRPLPVTVSAILLVLLSLSNFPWLFLFLFPGAEGPPAVALYLGYVLGVVGFVAAIGLWMLKPWSYWTTIVVSALNFLSGVPPLFIEPGVAFKALVVVTEVVAVLIIVLVMLRSSRRALTAS